MPLAPNVDVEVHLDADGAPQSMDREIREGLTSTPKTLPSKYFYDERGSALFGAITQLPEYYLTRSEIALLESRASVVAKICQPEEFVELGAGVLRKARILLRAGLSEGSLRRFIPVEVSENIVERAAQDLGFEFPQLEVHVVIGDFERHLGKVPEGDRRLVALLGSTIGNFPEPDAIEFLKKIGLLLEPGDWLLLGQDLVKETAVLEAAYNDDQGVTAQFNLNILNVINRYMNGDFDAEKFEHYSFFNQAHARIESYLRSSCDQKVRLNKIDLELEFGRGELLRTEVSCKYTRESSEKTLAAAGLRLEHWLVGDDRQFALSLSRLA